MDRCRTLWVPDVGVREHDRRLKTRIMRRNICVTALFLVAGCRNLQSADASLTNACVWSSRDSTWVDSGLAYVEPPLTAPIEGGLVMMGHSSVLRSVDGVVQRRSPTSILLAGLRFTEDGVARPIDLPAGVREFHRIRIAPVADAGVAAVWQGGRTVDDTSVSRLWTSTFAGGSWSTPRLLGDWETHDVGIYYGSALTPSGNALGLAVPEGVDTTVVYVKTTSWRRHAIPVPSLYAQLAPVAHGFLLGLIDGQGYRMASLGLDGHLGSFQSIASDGSDFHYPFLMAAGPANLVAAWVEGVGVGRSRIRVSLSHDGGVSWARTQSLTVDGGIESFDAVLSGNQSLYVAGRQSTDRGPWPFVATLDNGRWRTLPIPRMPREVGIVPPRFSRRPGGVELYWGLDDEQRVDREPPALVSVRLRSDCRN